ncbi:TraR/DksA C4-type zinc finger protein [Nocardioides sp.]|uniref:TraR/DksA family transcriptional regulator n=1 Tax=Nocardioides sp. TaxID=35761 RepID=UPI0027327FB8|nr:TraR/DksA C4-type zinc finger protein [Nocardioides sp.]MDP3894232.1 TraR/DksA C4-type zinc finger protein [Nocardioides sp.]
MGAPTCARRSRTRGRPLPEEPGARLAAQREELVARVAALRGDFRAIVEASAQANLDDEHDPEGATVAWERQQVDALVAQTERRLRQVEAALARVAEGGYGTCAVCGRPIDPARLEVRPDAATCVGCA